MDKLNRKLVFGNIHNIDCVRDVELNKFIVMEMSQEIKTNQYNTIYLDKKFFFKQEKCKLLCNGSYIESEENISINQIISGDYSCYPIEGLEKKQIIPLFFLEKKYDTYYVYSQLRFCEEDIIYIKTKEIPISEIIDIQDLINKAIKIHAENFVFLGNHQCYYRKMDSKKENEYKFNILDKSDPWIMINDLIHDVNNHKLADYIFEYKDGFQKWDYMNYMFQINDNDKERGYISFIPQTNGTYLIKRKIYLKDQLSRTEIHYKNVTIDIPLHQYIEEHFNLHDYIEFPPFRRVRYDINIENCKTGNVHGIFFDYITVENHNEVLKQCEIEYLRTRSLFDNEAYLDELKILQKYMVSFFKNRDISFDETFFSKLSFMVKVCNEKK